MKKSTIVILCIGIGLILLGAILGGLGWQMIGDPQAVLETLTIEGTRYSGGKHLDSEVRADGKYAVSAPVTGLELDWNVGNITMQTYDGTEICFTERTDEPLTEETGLRWEIDHGILTIQYCQAGTQQSLPIKDLEILIPSDLALDTVAVDITSADLTVQGLSVQSLTASGTSGGMELSELICTAAALETTSGEIRFQGQAQQLTADSTSGNIRIQQSGEDAEVLASANSGDILLYGMYLAATAETTSGTIQMDGSLQTVTATSNSGDVTLCSDTESVSIAVDTTSGDVALSIPAGSGFALVYDTSSGSMDCGLPLQILGEDEYLCGDGDGQFVVSTTSGDLKITATK